jgi:hypothetical protein
LLPGKNLLLQTQLVDHVARWVLKFFNYLHIWDKHSRPLVHALLRSYS